MNGLPDFIIIGAGKCGTTSLHNYLNQHPQVYICPKKETFFFLEEAQRNKFKHWGAVTSLAEYRDLFKDAPPNHVVGEISTNYYAYPGSAKLIHDLLPTVKLIAILREPAERAFSGYQMRVRAGHEKMDFESLISEDNCYIKRGFYYSELQPFLSVFDRDRIKIVLFDDLCQNAVGFMQDLFRYIEVDDRFVPDMSKRGREGGLPKNQTWNSLLRKPNPLRTSVAAVLKLFMPLEMRQKIRANLLNQNIYKAKLSPETRKRLIDIYRSDILQLQDLIERDLSAWLE